VFRIDSGCDPHVFGAAAERWGRRNGGGASDIVAERCHGKRCGGSRGVTMSGRGSMMSQQLRQSTAESRPGGAAAAELRSGGAAAAAERGGRVRGGR